MVTMKSRKNLSKTNPPYRGIGHFGHLGRYPINPEKRVLDILDIYRPQSNIHPDGGARFSF